MFQCQFVGNCFILIGTRKFETIIHFLCLQVSKLYSSFPINCGNEFWYPYTTNLQKLTFKSSILRPQLVLYHNSKPFDGKAPVLKVWIMRIIPSLPLLPGTFLAEVEVPDRASHMDRIGLFNHMIYLKSFCTVCKQIRSGTLNNRYLQTICLQIIYIINIGVQKGFGI